MRSLTIKLSARTVQVTVEETPSRVDIHLAYSHRGNFSDDEELGRALESLVCDYAYDPREVVWHPPTYREDQT